MVSGVVCDKSWAILTMKIVMKRIQMRNHTGFGSIVSSDICKISQKSSDRKKCLHSFMVPEVIISKLNQYKKFAFYVCSYIIKIVFQLCSAQCTVMRFDHFCPMQLYGSCDFQLWIDFESNFIFPSHLGREMKTAFDIFLPFQHD